MTNQSVSTSEQGPYPKISRVADDFIRAVGHYACWLNVVLILVILAQVTLRYGFGRGQIILEEIQWHLYAIAVMFAISYGVVTDAHIRMDIIYSSSTRKTKEWIEVFGQLLFVLPLAVILFLKGIDLVESAWRVNEGSASPGGLPWRWAIKAVLPVSMFLYMIASCSRLIRSLAIIFAKH